jgi:betaine-aldehyde dehydrogenase
VDPKPAAGTSLSLVLPSARGAYYGGAWHAPKAGAFVATLSPGTGESLGEVAHCSAGDVDAAVGAARAAYKTWRDVAPLERARLLRRLAGVVRDNARELAMIDAADCGNPYSAMLGDAAIAAAQLDFFAGLVTEMKGASIPMGPGVVNYSLREPLGVVAKILPFNHPFMFCAGKIAAPLAAGNTVVVKPPEQAPLSSLRFAELIDGLLPPGVFNLLPGGVETGDALVRHRHVAMVSVIGGVNTGRAVMRAAADRVKPVMLELGGKNALIAFADADPDRVAEGIVAGMNFAWCGQSCGSTSRAFLHKGIHDAVLDRLKVRLEDMRPGLPTDPGTRMGAIISRQQRDRIMALIESAKSEGARLIIGGSPPTDPALRHGYYIEPTVFAGVAPHMRIAREEIFGPVLAVLEWSDEAAMLEEVNAVEYGLTCSIWTNNLEAAHRAATSVEVGYVWINESSKHFLGAPFGGTKQSGFGREECLGELLSYTQEKNIHLRFAAG